MVLQLAGRVGMRGQPAGTSASSGSTNRRWAVTGTETRKVALVTGAGSGIGRACALTLQEHGYDVVLAGRRQAALDAVAQQAQGLAGAALAVACDVTDAGSVAALFDRVRERFGRLDVLFNNAGRSGSPVDIDQLDIDEWRSV